MAICFMLIAYTTHAAEHGLVINIGSRHFVGNDYNYNEENYGIGYSNYFESHAAYQFGIYDNSYNNWSAYAAMKLYGYNTVETRVNPFFMIGFVTGYEGYPFKPMVMVGADVEVIKTHKLNFMFAPIAVPKDKSNSNDTETDYGVLFGLQYEKLF